MKDWQVQIWLKFISKGAFLAAHLFYEIVEREAKRTRDARH